jgi:hypothetical protein
MQCHFYLSEYVFKVDKGLANYVAVCSQASLVWLFLSDTKGDDRDNESYDCDAPT